METNQPTIVAESDLAELRIVQGAYNELLLNLANIERQYRAQVDDLHSKIDNYERQMSMTFRRVQQKYGLEQNSRVNLETGAVE